VRSKWKNVIEKLRPFCHPDLGAAKKICPVFLVLPLKRIEKICPEFFYELNFPLPNGSHFYSNNVLYDDGQMATGTTATATTTKTIIMQIQIKINPEYQKLVPEIPAQEFAAIKADIKERGQLIPITVNDQGVILDGHHRYRACQELGIKCEFIEKKFDNELLEKLFVIDANLKRRHLNSFQRAELALKEKPILEELAKANREANLKQNSDEKFFNGKSSSVRNLTVGNGKGRVDEKIGVKAGISRDTVRKVELILAKAPKGLLEKLKIGKISINKAYKKLSSEERRQELINSKPLIELPNSIRLIHDDFRDKAIEIEIPNQSVDLILTDPPYEEVSLPLYKDLGIFAMRVLKDGGCLFTIAGHYALPRIISYIEESGLKYIHYFPIIHSGKAAFLFDNKIKAKHKPMLLFAKGRKSILANFIEDIIWSTPPDKTLHEWAQSPAKAEHVIKSLIVSDNQIVLDPFMGVGTFGLAAIKLNRKFIGIEIDKQNFEIAKANLLRGFR
jgi:ParB-like chromosome segregation protein Spo0J